MKRVLITGGCGFLGAHLCRRLLDEEAHVICLDDLSTGSRANVADLMDRAEFELLVRDVCEPLDSSVTPHANKLDEIYNLACPASPRYYQADPVQTTRTAVLGALNVLNLAVQTSAKVLQASTSEVYGSPLEHPQTEKHWGFVNPIGPRACYDEGKRCAESLFFDYRRQFGPLAARIKVARIFNTYGPGMAVGDGRVVSEFTVSALKGQALKIHGDGKQTRSFCYVDDMIEGLVRLMATDDEFTGPVNLGNPYETSINALIGGFIVVGGLYHSLSATHELRPIDDPERRCPDISLAKRVLDWEPKVPLDVGLARTIDYFRQRLKAAA